MRVPLRVDRARGRIRFLWCNPTQISQQAVSKRFLTFPAELFERVLKDLLPYLKLSWSKRKHRPLGTCALLKYQP